MINRLEKGVDILLNAVLSNVLALPKWIKFFGGDAVVPYVIPKRLWLTDHPPGQKPERSEMHRQSPEALWIEAVEGQSHRPMFKNTKPCIFRKANALTGAGSLCIHKKGVRRI